MTILQNWNWNFCNIIRQIWSLLLLSIKEMYLNHCHLQEIVENFWSDIIPVRIFRNCALVGKKIIVFQRLNNGCLSQKLKGNGGEMVFCYQNCSDLLWEKNVLVIQRKKRNSRLKAENVQNFWDHQNNLFKQWKVRTSFGKGPFKNYMDKILTIFDYLPTSTWIFFTLNVDKKKHFLTTYPPHLVHVVFEWP